MVPQDILHNVNVRHAISPQSLGATGSGGKVSKIIDRSGYDRVAFVADFGTIAATNAQVVATVEDGQATNALSLTSSSYLFGSASIGVTSARVSGVSKNVAKVLEYTGLNRYVQITLAPKVSGGIIAGVDALLMHPRTAPVPTAN